METSLSGALVAQAAGTATMPLVVQCNSPASLTEWGHAHRAWVDAALIEHGAILFRGFAVRTAPEFGECAQALCGTLLDYMYQSTPRTQVSQQIYTATEYPAAASIPQHNENAYQRAWPMRLLFGCLQVAAEGGETPLARSVDVTARIGRDLVDEFQERKVMYVRNYGDHVDLPWQTSFQTTSPAEVNTYCDAHGITCEWLPDEHLRTSQICQGVATHPATGNLLFFNQAHLFHPSSLGPDRHAAMLQVFGEAGLPRNARFGDGGEIDAPTLDRIRTAHATEAHPFGWENGDVLLVDNMLVSHGRQAFKGARTVLVAMGDRYPA